MAPHCLRRGRNLLLFGCDFFSTKRASEINFWNDLASRFASHFHEVVVLSINNRKIPREQLNRNLLVYNIRPIYFGSSAYRKDPDYTGSRFHKLPLSVLYKSYTFWRLRPVFDRLIGEHNIGIVHYMRIFGLFNQQLTRRYPNLLFTVTVPTHIDRGFPLHFLYHAIKNAALLPMDKVVPTSAATHDRLLKLGLPEKQLHTIHWTSEMEKDDPYETPRMRQELALSPAAQIVLWSGPLQDTNDAEFYYSLDIARKVSKRSRRFTFVFAFKLGRLKRNHLAATAGDSNIRVLETDHAMFSALKREATLFLSPICNPNRTVAPPLTWIEMMALGIPVLTTDVEGVRELVVHGHSGFIINSTEQAVTLLSNLELTEQVQQNCRDVVHRKYNIDSIASQYISMWQAAARELGKEEFVEHEQ